MRPARLIASLIGVVAALPAVRAKQPSSAAASAATGPCATPDSVAFRGLSRIPEGDVRSDIGITPKSTISGRIVTQALKNLYATNKFEANGTAVCEVIGGKTRPGLQPDRAPDPQRGVGRRRRQGVGVVGEGPGGPADRQADRPGAGRAGRPAHRLALPERGLLSSRKVAVDTVSDGAATTLIFPSTRDADSRSRASQVDGNKARHRRKDIVRRDEHEARRVLLVAEGRVRPGQVREGPRRSRSRSCTRRTATSTCRCVKDTLIVDRNAGKGARST